nr:FeoB-associated Cys-rich membrane protein [Dokdonia sinensis]
MEIAQNIIVFIIFALAVGYLFSKFVWMPPFLKKKASGGCGDRNCGCH